MPLTFDVRRFETIDSTNTWVMASARDGAPEGLVAVADHQTAGRGRLGRVWEAPAGANLLMTVLLRPPAGVPPHLALAAVALEGPEGPPLFCLAVARKDDLYLGVYRRSGRSVEALEPETAMSPEEVAARMAAQPEALALGPALTDYRGALETAGAVAATVDFEKLAQGAGETIRPTTVVIGGNPKAASPLIAADQRAGPLNGRPRTSPDRMCRGPATSLRARSAGPPAPSAPTRHSPGRTTPSPS